MSGVVSTHIGKDKPKSLDALSVELSTHLSKDGIFDCV